MPAEKSPALIIDDDRDTANLFQTVLEMAGIPCDVVYSAKNALVYLATNDPRMILLDMRLGLEISGVDILYQIRSNPRLDNVRVIVITAYPQLAAPIHDLADLVLIKPVEISHLQTLATRMDQDQPKPNTFREPLTNLYYYNFFLNRLEFAFERTRRRPDFLFCVVAIEAVVSQLDSRPIQNEEREHVLRIAAGQLHAGFRPTDTFGRLDRDRIVALYEDLKAPDDVTAIAGRLKDGLSRTYEVNLRRFRLQPCIGAVLNDGSYKGPVEVLQAAVDALEANRALIESVSA
jgi:PleD family two-component response regulator